MYERVRFWSGRSDVQISRRATAHDRCEISLNEAVLPAHIDEEMNPINS